MPIRVLSEAVASQIAAGEVVERPSSVVKELVENSIDAGARDVRVEARAGGKRLIRVTDDGCGVPTAEAEIAFHRHSTSKLISADDLSRITTLGFRGEALASISSVSHVTFVTRSADEAVGVLLRMEGGRTITRQESGRPPGTAVTVEELFFNVPARLKFLRTERTERRHIDAWLTRYAMAYPGVRFTLSHDGKTVFQSPGTDRLRDVLVAVYGLEVGAALLEVASEDQSVASDIGVTGFVSPPSLHRANRTYITLFVNGRWVQDARVTYAIVQAYHTLLPTGRYPLGVVMVRMPPADVDVNVHPAKSEVRFRDGDVVFRAVQRAVRHTLIQRSPVPVAARSPTAWPMSSGQWREDVRERGREQLAGLRPQVAGEQLRFEENPPDVGAENGGALVPSAERLPLLRVVGQLGSTYIIAEGPGGMYLVDQHAAHERVLFERLLAEREGAKVASQALLEPLPVELAPEATGLLEEHLETLSSLGFQLEPFGGTTMLVRSLPALVADMPPRQVLEDVAAALEAGNMPLASTVEEAVARRVCKRAAIKAGQVMAQAEMEELIRTLEQCVSPRTCPHGRPTMIHLSVDQLAHEFGR
ncbi:MAG: DNA mismatch repair endonuclease MutL [Chloroflexi bacterium]|nr:DNA mismatch repair endonuclease MutL [Chloroflexota bacterium]